MAPAFDGGWANVGGIGGVTTMASAMPEAQRMTADEFLELPERHDARGLELVDGEIVVNQPTWLHGTTFTRLLFALENWSRTGEARGRVSPAIDVLLDARNVFAPDPSRPCARPPPSAPGCPRSRDR